MPLKSTHRSFIIIIPVLLALLTAMSPFAIDTYLSSMPVMAKDFGVSINFIEFTLTVYFLGFSLGNFIGGPVSDAFGRKTVALIGVVIYGVAAGLIPLCTLVQQVWVLRAIQAFGGGFATVTAMVFVRDWFEGRQVARLATIIGMIMMLAPLFAPVLGTALSELFGWQSIFFFLSAYASMLFILFLFLIPESRDPAQLSKSLNIRQFFEKYKRFFFFPKAVLLLLTISFSMAGLFTFITGSSFAYIEYFGISSKMFPLVFGANVLLNVIFSLTNTFFLKWFAPEKMVRAALTLQLAAGATLLCFTLFPTPPFWGFFFGVVVYIGALGMIFGNGTAMILNQLPKIAGSANALLGVTRFVISFIAASLPALFYNGTLIPLAAVILGCAVASNLFFHLASRR